MATIVDVARHAGVSVTTVSRVINNSEHPVNPETRARILKSIQTLNFMPSLLARALVSEKTHLLGIIVGDGSDPYFANIVRGITDAAQQAGYLTIICNTERIPKVELSYLRLLRDYSADGIIFAGSATVDSDYREELADTVKKLRENNVRLIALSNQYLDMPQVRIDDVLATKEMTNYVIELGHRRIGFITGPAGLITSQLRLDGYRQALAEAGIPFLPELVVEGDFTYESGRHAAGVFLSQEPLPTAIFGSNDREALGCLFKLNEIGIQVPAQISVIGFDDIETTQYVHPPLTTVHVPMHSIGVIGVKQLLQDSGTDEQIHNVPHSLVIRASTAPPLHLTRE